MEAPTSRYWRDEDMIHKRDFAKTGIFYPVPRDIQKYGHPLPYFMQYDGPQYKRLKKLDHSRSNMNELCWNIERWKEGIRHPSKGKFDWHIMFNDVIGYDEEKFQKLEEIFLEFEKERKECNDFANWCHHWGLHKDKIKDRITEKEARVYSTNWIAIYERYRSQCIAVCPDMQERANILVVLCYDKYPKKYQKFAWLMAGNGIVANIEAVPVSLPQRDPDGEYEYLGQRYSLAPERIYNVEGVV